MSQNGSRRFLAVASVVNPLVRLRSLWTAAERHAFAHRHAYRAAHTCLHLTYLALVAAHGPYNLAAGVLFVVMAFGWALRLDAES
jgi:hypothetical protein